MLRIARLASVWATAMFASCLVLAQEPSTARPAPRVSLPKTIENGAPKADLAAPRRDSTRTLSTDRQPKATDGVREPARTTRKITPQERATALASLGARGPFDYAARGNYLVAAVRNGAGLALWETATGRRLLRFENSDRRYSLVAISDEGRWVAGVRHDDGDRIDLWRADNGRHLRVIRAPGGRKGKLEFRGRSQLLVVAVNGKGLVFSVPAGVALGDQKRGAPGGSAARTPSRRIESPKAERPAAPATTRAAPPTRRPATANRKAPSAAKPPPQVKSPPQDRAPVEPRIPTALAPRTATPRSRAITGQPPKQAPPLPTIEGPAASPGETTVDLAAPTPDEPASAGRHESPSAAPGEPALPEMSEPLDGAAPESTSEALAAPGSAPAGDSATRLFLEIGEELADETESEAAAAAQPPAETPPVTSVNIHFATNRNRLAPKDREWLTYFLGFFGTMPAFVIYGLVILALLILPWFGKRSWAAGAVVAGLAAACAMGSLEAYVRSQLRDEMSGELYGCRPTDLSYGTCEISVPPPRSRRPGELNRPVSVWVFEAPENPEKHFMLRRVEEYRDKDVFYHSLSAQLARSDAGAALLFIHGYNVSFEDAIFRTAQLAVDLKFTGAPIAFCWPSYADPVKYTFDEQNAEVSIPALREVLEDLAARSGAKRIHIIAHSMGNRVLAGALRNMDPAAQARNKAVFRELVLAAPDIDRRVFVSQVLPHIARNTQHCTLYASSRDRALLMSRAFHNYQRLGETEPELLVVTGLDTIDASLVDTSLFGHSYIGDVQSIVSDLHDLVVGGKRPAERLGLQLLQHNALKYWSIKPQLQTAAERPLHR